MSTVHQLGPFTFLVDPSNSRITRAWGPRYKLQLVHSGPDYSILANIKWNHAFNIECDPLCQYVKTIGIGTHKKYVRTYSHQVSHPKPESSTRQMQRLKSGGSLQHSVVRIETNYMTKLLQDMSQFIKECSFPDITNYSDLYHHCIGLSTLSNTPCHEGSDPLPNLTVMSPFCAGLEAEFRIFGWATCTTNSRVGEIVMKGLERQIWMKAYVVLFTKIPISSDYLRNGSIYVTQNVTEVGADWRKPCDKSFCPESIQGPTIHVYAKRNKSRVIKMAIKKALRHGSVSDQDIFYLDWQASINSISCRRTSVSSFRYICLVNLIFKGIF